jgi:hypothetical protein
MMPSMTPHKPTIPKVNPNVIRTAAKNRKTLLQPERSEDLFSRGGRCILAGRATAGGGRAY